MALGIERSLAGLPLSEFRITYAGRRSVQQADLETAFFAQDHWAVRPNLMFDIGSRLGRQRIAESFRIVLF